MKLNGNLPGFILGVLGVLGVPLIGSIFGSFFFGGFF